MKASRSALTSLTGLYLALSTARAAGAPATLPRVIAVSLAALLIVFAAWLPAAGQSGARRAYAAPAGARCKTVVKKVHGKKKKARVCKKAAPRPTPTPTLAPRIFEGPTDLVVAANGDILVSDLGLHQIITLSPDGVVLTRWPSDAGNETMFPWPLGITLDSAGNVYVTDTLNGFVEKLDPTGKLLARLSTNLAPADTHDARRVAVGPNGDLYVTDGDAPDILHLSSAGARLGVIGRADLQSPYDVTFGPNGNLYLTDIGSGLVYEYTPGGAKVASWGDGANGTVKFAEAPGAIKVDPAGNIYVTQSDRIIKFDQTGHVLAQWIAGADLTLNDALGLALDTAGNIYVAENGGTRIDKLSPAGQVLAVWQ